MDAPLAILCYHRVLPAASREAEGRPYFARGTAITVEHFIAQMEATARHLDVIGEAEVLRWLDGAPLRRPACWITFDDGYRDVIEHAAPVLARLGLPATAFITSAVVEEPGRWLPADAWYATLLRATRRRGELELPGGPPRAFNLARDFAGFVDGPERRRYLRAGAAERERILAMLRAALASPPLGRAALYLNRDDLLRLAVAGLSVGGHGHTHALLTHVSEPELSLEVQGPQRLLRELGLAPSTFAYPDGACGLMEALCVRRAGWTAALGLGGRIATRADGRHLLPRLLPGDEPNWIEAQLLPLFTG